MVANGDSNITDHINQSQYNSHYKEGMDLYLWNSKVFLVPILNVDRLDIAKQNVK